MGFKFAARALLELGKELISSDEIAVYELVKNSIDAQNTKSGAALSEPVEIAFNICLLRTDFERALEALRNRQPLEMIRREVSSRILLESDAGARAAFVNALDRAIGPSKFESSLISAYSTNNWIEVRDKGVGMSLSDLRDVYLKVGTRSKRVENLKGANFLGDKGVGRLSAMRLGDQLSIVTTKRGEAYFNDLNIDWTLFGHDVEAEASDIPVDPVRGRPKDSADSHGTTVRILGLCSDWQLARVMDMLQGPIARMVDPFQVGRGNTLLHVTYNGVPQFVPSIPPLLLKSAHATCKGSLRFEHGEPVFSGMIDYTARDYHVPFEQRGAELYSIAQRVYRRRGKSGAAATSTAPIRLEAIQELGPFEVEIYWYNRRIVDGIADLTENASKTRDQIAAWAGGVMLFRNGYRLLPYGEPDDDWLEVDKRAFAQTGYLLNRQQLLGRVTVHSSHMALSEQTNREGLIQSDSSAALVAIMKWLIHNEFRTALQTADTRERELKVAEAQEVLARTMDEQHKFEADLEGLRASIPQSAIPTFERVLKSAGQIVSRTNAVTDSAEQALRKVKAEREQLVYLAGIGLMTEFIFHELDRSVRQTLNELANARRPSAAGATLQSLEEQLRTLHKRVSAFDQLTGEKRQTKTRFDAGSAVRAAIESHSSEFERHGIQCHFEQEAFEVRAVKGMFIQIVENILSNSVYWLKQEARNREGFKPTITVALNVRRRTLEISDNGPGVASSRRERIFEAFVTSKPPGQGRGLGLYISRELANYHGWTLAMSQEIEQYRGDRCSTFVLSFGGG